MVIISSPRSATVTPITPRVEEAKQAPAAPVIHAAPKHTPVPTLVEDVNQAPAAPVTYAAPKHTYYTNSKLASSDVGYVTGISDDKHKKGVKSAEGTTALRTHRLNWSSSSSNNKPSQPQIQNYKPKEREPEKLCSITLKYCSTIGLIHAKILARPPNWDLEQARKKCSVELKRKHEETLSKINIMQETYETTDSQGKVVRTERREILDLTRWDPPDINMCSRV